MWVSVPASWDFSLTCSAAHLMPQLCLGMYVFCVASPSPPILFENHLEAVFLHLAQTFTGTRGWIDCQRSTSVWHQIFLQQRIWPVFSSVTQEQNGRSGLYFTHVRLETLVLGAFLETGLPLWTCVKCHCFRICSFSAAASLFEAFDSLV